jgi:ribosomal protein L29
MNADEDELQNLRKEYIGLQQQLAAAQAALHDAIQQMNVDLDVSGV